MQGSLEASGVGSTADDAGLSPVQSAGCATAIRPPQRPAFAGLWAEGLRAAAEQQTPWLWHGYVAPGVVTLLTSQWKSGKTTLVAVLLARLKDGGTFAGLPLRAGKVVIISEESPRHWLERSAKLHFGDHLCWFCRPFRGRPKFDEWIALLDHILALKQQHQIDLVVIDPLAAFLPVRSENLAGDMLDALLSLQRLTAAGLAVLILHHPRKGERLAGQAARGSGALSGYVDIILEMECYSADDADRRRRMLAYSRFEATPRRLVLELSGDGTDYLNHGDFDEEAFKLSWQQPRSVLEEAHGKLTRRDILSCWPPDYKAPDDVTLWRWLERGVSLGLIRREGNGRRCSPYRYWLPGKEKLWPPQIGLMPELSTDDLKQVLKEARQTFKKGDAVLKGRVGK